ncbi:MAG: hypothetical protein D6720_03070 [Gammaproteobacteria bacterium]|nr:MAG: hypothetical protein D6720_03070 [Gammaproteobacteria bacterium]
MIGGKGERTPGTGEPVLVGPLQRAPLAGAGPAPRHPKRWSPPSRSGWHGLYVELKMASGRVSGQQRQCLQALQEQGYRVAACRGWQAVSTPTQDIPFSPV